MKTAIFSILFTILMLLVSTAIGLGIIHITDFPYIADIDNLKISETTGYSENEIMDNYNSVMNFLVPFSNRKFSLPTMLYSNEGSNHFYDCKVIFTLIYSLGIISLILIIIADKMKLITKSVLRISGVLTLTFPLTLSILFSINFNSVFVKFHEILFNNNDWQFNPVKDEIINILPEEFFMHCGVFIVLFWILSAFMCLSLSKVQNDNKLRP